MPLRSIATNTAALLILLTLAASSNPSEHQRPLTACDLLTSPCLYENKKVIVYGEELPGGHGPYFTGASCTAQGKLPDLHRNAISLDLPQEDDPALDLSVAEGIRAARRLEQELGRKAGSHRGKRAFITIEGVFQSVYDCKGGHPEKPYRLGFGAAPLATTRILIQRVLDVKVR
jgi:hypothetical protein